MGRCSRATGVLSPGAGAAGALRRGCLKRPVRVSAVLKSPGARRNQADVLEPVARGLGASITASLAVHGLKAASSVVVGAARRGITASAHELSTHFAAQSKPVFSRGPGPSTGGLADLNGDGSRTRRGHALSNNDQSVLLGQRRRTSSSAPVSRCAFESPKPGLSFWPLPNVRRQSPRRFQPGTDPGFAVTNYDSGGIVSFLLGRGDVTFERTRCDATSRPSPGGGDVNGDGIPTRRH